MRRFRLGCPSEAIPGLWVGSFAVSLGFLVLGASPPREGSSVEKGQNLYRIYCRSCHGENARGDGPTAGALEVRPPDLTRLSEGNDGQFPTAAVADAIDGRPDLPAHGTREMPIWGFAFQQFNTDVGQEQQVRVRIGSLVLYLESIQSTPDP